MTPWYTPSQHLQRDGSASCCGKVVRGGKLACLMSQTRALDDPASLEWVQVDKNLWSGFRCEATPQECLWEWLVPWAAVTVSTSLAPSPLKGASPEAVRVAVGKGCGGLTVSLLKCADLLLPWMFAGIKSRLSSVWCHFLEGRGCRECPFSRCVLRSSCCQAGICTVTVWHLAPGRSCAGRTTAPKMWM